MGVLGRTHRVRRARLWTLLGLFLGAGYPVVLGYAVEQPPLGWLVLFALALSLVPAWLLFVNLARLGRSWRRIGVALAAAVLPCSLFWLIAAESNGPFALGMVFPALPGLGMVGWLLFATGRDLDLDQRVSADVPEVFT